MTKVVGVRFKKMGKVYYFDPQDLELHEGLVVVETANGTECGELVFTEKEVPDDQIVSELKKVLRQATSADEQRLRERDEKKAEALRICEQKIAAHQLEMKLIDVDIAFDGSKITFFFTADGRVDFRELVKDLAHVFRMRIELRQIGVRDETKMMGGIGACGRVCCCTAFLGEFAPVSIKMAKEQNLSLNPTKISGLCGRLMCCLKYEQNYYEQVRREMPRAGKEVTTPDGVGMLLENNVLKKTCRVRVTLPDQTMDVRTYSLEDIRRAEAGLPPLKQQEEEMPEAVLVSERRAPRRQNQEQPRRRENKAGAQQQEKRSDRPQQGRRRPPRANDAQSAKSEGTPRQMRPQNGQHNAQQHNANRGDGQRNRQTGQQGRSTQRQRPPRQAQANDSNAATETVTLRPAQDAQKTGAPRRRNNNARRRPRPQQNRSPREQEIVRLVPAEKKQND